MFQVTYVDRRGEITPPMGSVIAPHPVQVFPTREAAQDKAEDYAKLYNRPYYIVQIIGRTDALYSVETVWA